jgi:hypothetical protein
MSSEPRSSASGAEQRGRPSRGRAHGALLALFSALFAFRVVAQYVQRVWPTPLLPPLEAWQGSSLRYPLLLASQIVILIAMVGFSIAVFDGLRVDRRSGGWLLALGGIYFAVMGARLVLGLTLLADVPWFQKWLPAVFHLVLASYVLTLGHHHRTAAGP